MEKKKIITLPPIREKTEDYEKIEKRIKAAFRKYLYEPLLKEINAPLSTIRNAKSALTDALNSGRVTYSRGVFSGKLNAEISKELRSIGAVFDRRLGAYRLPLNQVPVGVRQAIGTSEARFLEKIAGIDRKLEKISPEEIAGKVKTKDLFDTVLYKTDRDLEDRLKKIQVKPSLSKTEREKVSKDWENNLDLWIQDFTREEIPKLRKEVSKSILAGNRYESLIESIQKSYEVSANKAKFLARQETSLLISKFQETRYQSVGIEEYTWHSVVGSPNHPVRPRHKELAEASKRGKTYKWSDPPVTTAPGEPERRNNPGQDYNCRCYARPVVRFKETKT